MDYSSVLFYSSTSLGATAERARPLSLALVMRPSERWGPKHVKNLAENNTRDATSCWQVQGSAFGCTVPVVLQGNLGQTPKDLEAACIAFGMGQSGYECCFSG